MQHRSSRNNPLPETFQSYGEILLQNRLWKTFYYSLILGKGNSPRGLGEGGGVCFP